MLCKIFLNIIHSLKLKFSARSVVVAISIDKWWQLRRRNRCTPQKPPLGGAMSLSTVWVDGRGLYSPCRVDIFVIPIEEKRVASERNDNPGNNINKAPSF